MGLDDVPLEVRGMIPATICHLYRIAPIDYRDGIIGIVASDDKDDGLTNMLKDLSSELGCGIQIRLLIDPYIMDEILSKYHPLEEVSAIADASDLFI